MNISHRIHLKLVQHQISHRKILKRAAQTAIALAVCAFSYSATQHYVWATSQAQQEVQQAQQDRDDVLAVLNGKATFLEIEPNSKYAKVASLRWETVAGVSK